MLPDTESADHDNSPILKVAPSPPKHPSLVPKKFKAMARDVSPTAHPRLAPTLSTPQFQPRPLSPLQTVCKASPMKQDSGGERSFLNDLLMKVERVERRMDKFSQIQARFEILRTSVDSLEGRLAQFEDLSSKAVEVLNATQSSKDSPANEENIKQFPEWVLKEEWEKGVQTLESRLKTSLAGVRSAVTAEVRDIHAKEKKMLVEIVAAQLNQQLASFKEGFSQEWTANWEAFKAEKREPSPSRKAANILGVARQEFVGTAVPVTLRQQLVCAASVSPCKLATRETTYYVDANGYLLDSKKHYLLDSRERQVRLNEAHLRVLEQEGLLGGAASKENERPYTPQGLKVAIRKI